MAIRVAVVGATGKLGSVAVSIVEQADDLELVAALNSSSPLDQMNGADVVFDATVPAASQAIVEHAIAHGIRALVGTSGWSRERIAHIRSLVDATPGAGVIFVPNFSLGSVLATSFAATAAKFFDSIEIVEAHGAAKVDSPSGTAVRTAELIGAAREELGPVIAPHSDQRARGQQVSSVPIHSLRMRGVIARQDVILGGTGEVLTISHETLSSSSYEAGLALGLRAAAEATGVTVGLDKLIDLGGASGE